MSKSSLCAFVHYGTVVYIALVVFSCNSHSAGNTQLKSTVKQGESQVTEVKNKNVYNLQYSAFDPPPSNFATDRHYCQALGPETEDAVSPDLVFIQGRL